MFTLIWNDAALDDFADLYVAAGTAERTRMAAGVADLNRRLADRPMSEGESRGEDVRITFPPLLSVRFRVDLMADTVRVITVGRYGR